jgi:putative peptidoglycan lipid II flippase
MHKYFTLAIRGMKIIMFVSIPIVTIMLVSGKVLVEIAFERGEFIERDTIQTTYAFFFYSIGLIFIALRDYFVRCFIAIKSSKIIMYTSISAVAINIVASVILSKYIAHGGIALGTSISFFIQAIVLFTFLYKKGQFSNGTPSPILKDIIKMIISFILLFISSYFLEPYLTQLNKYLHLLIMSVFTFTIFIIISYLLKLNEISVLLNILKRKKVKAG